MREFSIPQALDGAAASRALAALNPDMPAMKLRQCLKSGQVRLNGARIRAGATVFLGDSLAVYLPDAPPPRVLFEDADFIIVEKMPWQSVDEDPYGAQTLWQAVGRLLESQGEAAVPAHRLDHHTGGAVAFAKTERGLQALLAAFAQNRAHKSYWCLTAGRTPKGGELLHYATKDAELARVTVYDDPRPGALSMRMRLRPLICDQDICLCEICLLTGRTHQIRAQLAHIGSPVLGCDKYGDRRRNKELGASHQALWARELAFEAHGPDDPLRALEGRSFISPPQFRLKRLPEAVRAFIDAHAGETD